MPAKTQDFSEMLNITETMYEAVMVIAKRSRQINEEMYQKKRDRQILEELEGGFEDEFMHAEHEEAEAAPAVDEDVNPIVSAQDEFKSDKLSYHYETRRA